MITRLFAVLLVAILGLGLGAPAHAHGTDHTGTTRAVASPSAQTPSAGQHVMAGTTDAVVELASAVVGAASDSAPATPIDDHCHCDGGVCSAAAPLPPSAGRTARLPQGGGPPLADQVAALNVVDPLLQPPER